MPGYNQTFNLKDKDGNPIPPVFTLSSLGPLIQVQIRPPKALLAKLPEEERKKKPLHEGMGLIDTGAAFCMVKASIAKKLKLTAHSTTIIASATEKEAQRNVYIVGVAIGDFRTDKDPIPAAELTNENLPFDFIVGRDILSNMVFIYNGFGGMITLAE